MKEDTQADWWTVTCLSLIGVLLLSGFWVILCSVSKYVQMSI